MPLMTYEQKKKLASNKSHPHLVKTEAPAYTKQPVLPPKDAGRTAVKQIVDNLWTGGSLSPKTTIVYRGQTVTPMPELKGGDFKSTFNRYPDMKAESGKFWTQSPESAKAHAKIVGRAGNTPVAVWKAETTKVDVLKGQRGVLQHNKKSGKHFIGDPSRHSLKRAKQNIRAGTLYQTIMDPPNKRLSISQTAAVNPNFTGVKGPALKSLAQVGMRVGSRLLGAYGVVDMIVNPTPAYNPKGGYKGKADPRKRRKATVAGIR